MVVFTVSKKKLTVEDIVDILSRGNISDIPRNKSIDPFYEISVARNGLIEIQKVYSKDSAKFQIASNLYNGIVDMYKWTQG